MKIHIKFPSGATKDVIGEWKGFEKISKESSAVAIKLKDGTMFLGDPRSVYREIDTDKVLYNPKDFVDEMNPNMADWMRKNPEWPHPELLL